MVHFTSKVLRLQLRSRKSRQVASVITITITILFSLLNAVQFSEIDIRDGEGHSVEIIFDR